MPEYTIRWEIDIEADTPEIAAAAALTIQRNPNSAATFFEVFNDKGYVTSIDVV